MSVATYNDQGIAFSYPDAWELAEEQREDAHTITLTDGVAFWTITLMWDRPAVDRVLREALGTLQEDYDDLDVADAFATLSGRQAAGLDLEFLYLELVNMVSLRAFRTGRFTAFIMYQMTDHEREQYDDVFSLINQSLDCDRDGDIIIA